MPTLSTKRAATKREVFCTHCGEPSEVGQRAMSVFCPHCKKRLILEDFKVTSYRGVREFATCGDIVIEKRGHVAAMIKVGNLTVKGKVQGSITARGFVKIHKTAQLQGDIQAPTLKVASGAKLDGFLRIGDGRLSQRGRASSGGS